MRVHDVEKQSVARAARRDVEVRSAAADAHKVPAHVLSIKRGHLCHGHEIRFPSRRRNHDDIRLPARAAEVADIRDLQEIAVSLVKVMETRVGDPVAHAELRSHRFLPRIVKWHSVSASANFERSTWLRISSSFCSCFFTEAISAAHVASGSVA
jgi:hypothetical protein